MGLNIFIGQYLIKSRSITRLNIVTRGPRKGWSKMRCSGVDLERVVQRSVSGVCIHGRGARKIDREGKRAAGKMGSLSCRKGLVLNREATTAED